MASVDKLYIVAITRRRSGNGWKITGFISTDQTHLYSGAEPNVDTLVDKGAYYREIVGGTIVQVTETRMIQEIKQVEGGYKIEATMHPLEEEEGKRRFFQRGF